MHILDALTSFGGFNSEMAIDSLRVSCAVEVPLVPKF